MELIVYADILFCWNYLMDLQIVFLTSIFLRGSYSLLRMSITTGILALYGTLSFMPELSFFYSLIGKVLVSTLAVFLLTFPGRWQRFWKGMGIFHLVSFGIGGVVFALAMGTDIGKTLRSVAVNGHVYLELNFWVLLSGIGLSYLLLLGFQKITVRNFSRDKVLVKMSFVLQEKEFLVTTLMDTGCELTAPLTGEGVLLVSASVLKNVQIIEEISLPIHTAGGDCYLKAFYPKQVYCLDNRYQLAEHPLIAVGSGEFSADGLYQSICNPKIFQEINQNGGRKDDGKMEIPQTDLSENLGETRSLVKKRCLLHWRKRSIAGTSWQGRRGEITSGTQPATDLSQCQTDLDREKSAVGGLHSQKV